VGEIADLQALRAKYRRQPPVLHLIDQCIDLYERAHEATTSQERAAVRARVLALLRVVDRDGGGAPDEEP
jgi:hypothetical protein